MNEPDYGIEETLDPEQVRVYFRVYCMRTLNAIGPRFGTLEHAKEFVRMCRKYKDPIWHYVED